MDVPTARFKKEQLRTDVYSNGCVRARGERPVAVGSSKWIRFQKELKLPDNCDIEGITSKFAKETLTVTLPKKRRPSPPDGWAGS
ncbi:hypothetical protein BAE44_0002802 [Dichanthelium oligosanthes]|uniref:SHSP domain-containing protein n=1 Tax=Dichanthelium oligosanthes TaxID=888268 RepID=A0A1E5WFT9_9POAL|nr:hypothetical protein BAE44_0002802 [Dichanthelium oligosanthes]